MKAKTKRVLVIGSISLTVSLLVGASLRALYESEGWPEPNVHNKYYPINGIAADLLSSLMGILAWEGSTLVIKRFGSLKDYFYEIPPIQDTENNDVESNWEKLKRYTFSGTKIMIAALAGMGMGSVVKGIYDAINGPDPNIKIGEVKLDGVISDVLSNATAVIIFNAKPICQDIANLLRGQYHLFRSRSKLDIQQIPLENSSLLDKKSCSSYEI